MTEGTMDERARVRHHREEVRRYEQRLQQLPPGRDGAEQATRLGEALADEVVALGDAQADLGRAIREGRVPTETRYEEGLANGPGRKAA